MSDMRVTLLIAAGALLLTSGCVSAVTATAGAVAGAGKVAAKTTVGVASAGVDVVTPGDDDKHHQHHDDDDPRPFDASRNAMQDVDVALAAAGITGKRPLLVLGGNWCHDSRGLAAKFQEPELARVIADGYELVWIDVGHRDRNLEVAGRFGVFELLGTPTVLILSPDGALLNAGTMHDWRTADSKPYGETLDYFREHAAINN